MKILLIGASGFIGSPVLARLAAEGHEIAALVRPSSPCPPAARCIRLDLEQATDPAHWLPHLSGIDAVVNCAGVLQDTPSDSTAAVHVDAPVALYAACERAGVRRIVHISALGAAAGAPTAFARTKHAGDAALVARDLDWVILRPSVVVGRAAYGGSALLRALAALPIAFEMPGAGDLQIVQLDDLVRTVAFFLVPGAPARLVLDVVGPDRLRFTDVVRLYRRWLGWLGWREAPLVRLPAWTLGIATWLGDLAGGLGWRSPLRSTARVEIMRGSVGSPAEWTRITGIVPRSLAAALAAEPASVQERWFARLYLAKPLLLAAFALFWIATGCIALGPGWPAAVGLLRDAGVAAPAAAAVVLTTALADVLIGAGILIRRTARPALRAALAVSVAYLAAGTLLVPGLWSDPLGPLVKVLPIIALNVGLLAILDDR